MYQKPKLVPVGQVNKVVLGLTPVGADIDCTFTSSEQEYAMEREDESESDETL